MSDLTRLVRDLPDEPGVYMWKDEEGNILYIGKSKFLRRRVASYIKSGYIYRRTWNMMHKVNDLEVIVTSTEREALLLEATLIKKHQPPYNIRLKDDKVQTWIRVNLEKEIPSFEITREIQRDSFTYYGPYGGSKRLERLFDTIRKYIPICSCKDPEKQKRECMDFHLGRCVAPCTGRISPKEYRSLVDQMGLFLDGQLEQLRKLLESQMEEASKNMEFERAASIRDRLYDITQVLMKQKVVEFEGINRDIVGISRTEQAALIELLIVRGGRLIGHDNFFFDLPLEIPDTEVLKAFVEQYYFDLPRLPDEILLPQAIEDMEQLTEWLSEINGVEVSLITPKDEDQESLVNMANTNAERALRKILILEDHDDVIVHEGVKELRELLGLNQAPLHIEGFDIANIQGTDPTGSCVVFKNGAPENKSYRMFKVRSKETPDDYTMMHEVVYRRYRGVLERGDPLPDLIVIDGGKGQLNVAIKAVEELGLDTLNVASIAKKEEIIFTRDNMDGFVLEYGSNALRLVQHIRDEAHRFAQRYHHKLREKRFSGSILEEAPGIGPKRRAALLQRFGSYERVLTATVDELASVFEMTEKAARQLREWLDKQEE